MWITLTDSQRSCALLGNVTVQWGTWAFHPRNTRTKNFQDFLPRKLQTCDCFAQLRNRQNMWVGLKQPLECYSISEEVSPSFLDKSSIKVVLSCSIKPVRSLTVHFISLGQNCKLGACSWLNFLSWSTGELFIGKCGFDSSSWLLYFHKANPSAGVSLTCTWKLMSKITALMRKMLLASCEKCFNHN